eukprot:3008853-Rhodomonas_salina.4
MERSGEERRGEGRSGEGRGGEERGGERRGGKERGGEGRGGEGSALAPRSGRGVEEGELAKHTFSNRHTCSLTYSNGFPLACRCTGTQRCHGRPLNHTADLYSNPRPQSPPGLGCFLSCSAQAQLSEGWA